MFLSPYLFLAFFVIVEVNLESAVFAYNSCVQHLCYVFLVGHTKNVAPKSTEHMPFNTTEAFKMLQVTSKIT